MTLQTLLFLRELLNSQTIAVRAPDFDETVARVSLAKTELDAAIAMIEDRRLAGAAHFELTEPHNS